jgi:hypothetical protein
MKYCLILILFFSISSCGVVDTEKQKDIALTKESILNASNWIDEHTLKKDFEKASKYYFDGTQFFQYQKYNREEVVTSQYYPEAKSALQLLFKTKGMQIVSSEVINQDVTLHENNEGTVFTVHKRITAYNGLGMKSTDSIGRIFGIKGGKLTVLQEHTKSKL